MKHNQCHSCGKFSCYEEMDSYTPYGCENPAQPSPHDPVNICSKCSKELKQEWLKRFETQTYKNYGDWQKSRAEIEASQEAGFTWIGNNSSIIIAGRRLFCEYVPNSLLEANK